VLTEAWLPGALHASVNGTPAACWRVNHAFRGILVPGPGRWRIEVAYRPPLFDVTLGIAAEALVLLVAWLGWAAFLEPGRRA
jgi:hypothetical protein